MKGQETRTTVGSTTYSNAYDHRSNIVQMPHLSSITFNAANEMSSCNLGGGGNVYYQYSGGQRGRKTVINGSLTTQRIYMGNHEIYRSYTGSTLNVERRTVHVADDTGRIAMYEYVSGGGDSYAPVLSRYIYSNHLSTATLELDNNASIISYEEYHPYGTTAFQEMNAAINATAKRYRYVGKERDEESGFYYMSARYYAPWLGRWCACDPINSEVYNYNQGQPDRNIKRDFVELSASSYEYCYDNPVRFTDPTGEQAPVQSNVDISEDAKTKFRQQAMGAQAVKDAIKRGDKVLLDQEFFIRGNGSNLTSNITSLNDGTNGHTLRVHQEGALEVNGEAAGPGQQFVMYFTAETYKKAIPAMTGIDNAPPIMQPLPIPITNTPPIIMTNNINRIGRQINRTVGFIPADPKMTPGGTATVDQIAALIPRTAVTQLPPVGFGGVDTGGGFGIGVNTTVTTGAMVRINLLTNNTRQSPTNLGPNTGAVLQTRRFNAIRNQLILRGVPANNIVRGTTEYGQNPQNMGGSPNQVQFVITPFTRTTNTVTVNKTR